MPLINLSFHFSPNTTCSGGKSCIPRGLEPHRLGDGKTVTRVPLPSLAVRASSCRDGMFHFSGILCLSQNPLIGPYMLCLLQFLRRALWFPFGNCRGPGHTAGES